MSIYKVSDLLAALEGKIHDQSLDKLSRSMLNKVDEAARKLLLSFDLKETKRYVNLESAVFPDVNIYAAPSGLKGDSITTIRPVQSDKRNISSRFTKTSEEEVSLAKGSYEFIVDHNNGNKFLRMNVPEKEQGIILSEFDGLAGGSVNGSVLDHEVDDLNYISSTASTKITLDKKVYTTKVTNSVFNVYPIYDWTTEDIWIYHSKNENKRFNQLYELMFKAGVSIHQQRICQPYGDDQRRGLWLFHLIEPETWAKVVARVNGANSGALYINESGSITGYNKITKPKNHTWESFAMLFLNSIPDVTKEHYLNKIYTFIKWWEERGYLEGIPDEAPYILESEKLAPSWRRICKSLLRNDFWCKGLGFTQHKTDAYKKYLELKKKQREENKYLTKK